MKRLIVPVSIFVTVLLAGCATLENLNASLTAFGENLNQKSIESTSAKNRDADKWNVDLLDTARNVDYLSTIEKDVVLEMNKARSNPALYAELYIEPRLKYFDGKLYDGSLMTQEGAAVVQECVNYMKKAKPLSLLSPMKGLSLAAQTHAKTQGETEQTGHTGVDGSSPFTRIGKYGTYKTAGENIAYGTNSGRDIVVSLLIDDGVSSRGHRKNILNKDFSETGCGYAGHHMVYGSECVITYAGGYKEK